MLSADGMASYSLLWSLQVSLLQSKHSLKSKNKRGILLVQKNVDFTIAGSAHKIALIYVNRGHIPSYFEPKLRLQGSFFAEI
jgi:hypothetical protein